jgi:hypothetical protein
MNALTTELERAKARLRTEKFHESWNYRSLSELLEQLAGFFLPTNREKHREIMARFHDCAGRLPYIFDQDIGALILEVAAHKSADRDLRAYLLTEALFRATWCAQSSTSGGEGIARSEHVTRLNNSLSGLI